MIVTCTSYRCTNFDSKSWTSCTQAKNAQEVCKVLKIDDPSVKPRLNKHSDSWRGNQASTLGGSSLGGSLATHTLRQTTLNCRKQVMDLQMDKLTLEANALERERQHKADAAEKERQHRWQIEEMVATMRAFGMPEEDVARLTHNATNQEVNSPLA